ncbi:MAG TPA: ABC transporter permease [Mobilitalea sp.]|nr:ABC transporter permease [Mobilitalea sp.]
MIISRKALINSFRQYISLIYKDAMLIMLMLAPLLCGLFFKFGIPYAQELIEHYFEMEDIFVPYYLLFDLFLGSITPLLYCFASAYIILGEIDDGISGYLSVTPLSKKGYLISRLGLPTLIASLVSLAAISIFSLSEISIMYRIGISIMGAFLGFMEALLVVSIAGNRVEGLAVSKLSGLFFLGLPIPFFVKDGVQYLVSFLPSFWVAKYAIDHNVVYMLISIVVSLVWIKLLYKRLIRKLY